MADEHRMTTEELVRKTLLDEHGDFVKEAVAMFAARLMEAEITEQIGAGRGELAPGLRSTYRNGYRPRAWDAGRGDRAGDPAQALGGGVLSVVSGAAPAV